ncbi:MAG TPA: ABC transporter substrate-binding protein [Thermodesulfobacteriota bacterium]|nr:ABC transporter substrate-binding protein [Thermodesulfobacteriota bacterium]
MIGVATSLQLLEGWESLQAVELAVEEINNRGGVRIGRESLPLRLKILDLHESSDEGPVSQALLSLETFIQTEQPRAILVGPFRSEVLLAGMDMLAKSRIPLLGTIAMSPASEVKILKDPRYKNIFRLGLDSKYLVEYLIKIMRFLKEKFHFRKVYIINQDVAWTRSAASMLVKLYFEKAGWEVIALDTYPSGASDFTEGLKKAREKKAQLILPIFDMPESHLLVKQWNDMKVPALLCGFISPMVGPGAWGRFGNMIAGSLNVIFEMGNVPSTSFKPANDFYQAYRNKFGEEIEAGHGPAPAYESVYVLAEAIERAGSLDPDRLIKALEQTDRLGSMGRIRFHRGHQVIFGEDPDKEAVACVLQWGTDGRRTIVYPPAVAEGKIALPPNLHQFPKSRR